MSDFQNSIRYQASGWPSGTSGELRGCYHKLADFTKIACPAKIA